MTGVGVLIGDTNMRTAPPEHVEQEIALLRHIRFCQQVFRSDASWEYKYDRIFGVHHRDIRPLLSRMRVGFEWCDPDTTEEADVTAYMDAIERNLLPNIEAVVEGEFDEDD